MHTYSKRQRRLALLIGIACHSSFVLGIAAMMLNLYYGLTLGRGSLAGPGGIVANAFLLLQFAVIHSFLLGESGRKVLVRLVPLGLGRDLSTTTFALLSSLQLLLTFSAWSPIGPVWWEAQGTLRFAMTVIYAASWLFLLKAMADAGLAVQTGFLGWSAVVRGRPPQFKEFTAAGTFRYMRQPIYLAFALTLWTGPVWTVDHLMVALGWTLYCLAGPLLKERRYLTIYGARFERYRQLVPYWLPATRGLEVARLDDVASATPQP